MAKTVSNVITVDALDMSLSELQREVVSLRRRNARLIALLRLIFTVMKAAHFTLAQIWLPKKSQGVECCMPSNIRERISVENCAACDQPFARQLPRMEEECMACVS
tara:strand:+ start:31296 stop:31613 length:318 start_codon:yes stop_codon:yes gene_type:complete